MRKITLLFVSLLLAGAQMLQAQRTITGTVISDSDNQGIPGVSVKVKGTTTGTSTDINGHYNISVPANANVFVFSFMGMKTQEVSIDGRSTIDIVMTSDAVQLDAVVVTGYGVSRKVAFTGSAMTVNEGVIGSKSDANVINSLQGSVPGLQISINNGQPGASSNVMIRGMGSVSLSSRPLYVIDGVPLTSASNTTSSGNADVDPLSSINQNDIESISVLKDASATAIYGSRAANGVIVITTKSGKEGKTQFSFSLKEGRTYAPRLRQDQRIVNAEDFITQVNESFENAGLTGHVNNLPLFVGNNLVYNSFDDGIDTDWWDVVTRPGTVREYSLSAQGGGEKTKYFISGSFGQDEGWIIASGIKRYTGRVNLSHDANKYVSFGINLSGSFSKTTNASSGGDGETQTANPIFLAQYIPATQPVYHTGQIPGYAEGTWNLKSLVNGHYNPMAMWTDPQGNQIYQDLMKATISPFVRINILPNLSLQSKAGIDYYSNMGTQHTSPLFGDGKNFGGYTQKNGIDQSIMTITNTLNWMPRLGKHGFNILLGQEANTYQVKRIGAWGENFPTADLTAIDIAAITDGGSSSEKATLSSYFASAEYDFNNKYYASASVRRDGSSRFAAGHRWGTFYSVGGKWRISQENFFAPIQNIVSNATLRASYGTTGNQGVGYFAALGLDGYGAPYNENASLFPSQLENPDLTWESRNKFNVGIDLEFASRVSVELDYYNDVTKDMLFGMPISMTTGFSSITRNIGSMRNSGFEFLVSALLVNQKNVRWNFGLNGTMNKNQILKLHTDDPFQTGNYFREEGQSWYQLNLKQYAGIDPATGLALFYKKDGTTTWNINDAAVEANRKKIGDVDPKLYGGFNTKVDFYGFDFGVQFNYRIGGYYMSASSSNNEHTGNSVTPLNYYIFNNRWQKPGDVSGPRLDFSAPNFYGYGSTQLWIDASFLKLKNITLGWTVPAKWTNKIKINSARIYVQADNLWWIANKEFRGMDPDTPLSGRLDFYGYQPGRNFHVGVNLKF